MLYGSLPFIDHAIKILHVKDFADPNDWSDPIPTKRSGEWMVILTKHLLMGQRNIARVQAGLGAGDS